MWEPLRRFNALEPHARGLFLRALASLAFISLSLRLRGFRATQLSLQKRLPIAGSTGSVHLDSGDAAPLVALTARMVRAAAYRGVGPATCLDKALTLWWLLSRQGIESKVRIGARKNGEKFEAHAWVECGGKVLNEPQEEHKHYAAFDEAFPVLEGAKK